MNSFITAYTNNQGIGLAALLTGSRKCYALDEYRFPSHILNDNLLRQMLAEDRIIQLRSAIKSMDSCIIHCVSEEIRKVPENVHSLNWS